MIASISVLGLPQLNRELREGWPCPARRPAIVLPNNEWQSIRSGRQNGLRSLISAGAHGPAGSNPPGPDGIPALRYCYRDWRCPFRALFARACAVVPRQALNGTSTARSALIRPTSSCPVAMRTAASPAAAADHGPRAPHAAARSPTSQSAAQRHFRGGGRLGVGGVDSRVTSRARALRYSPAAAARARTSRS